MLKADAQSSRPSGGLIIDRFLQGDLQRQADDKCILHRLLGACWQLQELSHFDRIKRIRVATIDAVLEELEIPDNYEYPTYSFKKLFASG